MISKLFSKWKPSATMASDDLVAAVRERYEESAYARTVHDNVILTSMAFEAGKQWVEYNSATGRLDSLIGDDDAYYFITNNQIRPLVLQNMVRATQTRPDMWVAPLTESETDRLAAEEARSILAHCSRLVDRSALLREWVFGALVSSTTFVKVCWDPTREAEIAVEFDNAGNVRRIAKAAIGDVRESVLLPLDVYPDPKAQRMDDCDWVIHARVCSMAQIAARYPERAGDVRADTIEALHGGVEQRLAMITDDAMRYAEAQCDAATVLEMWEKPSAACPRGRLVTVAGDVLLRDDPWPYTKTDSYPFIPLAFNTNISSLYGRNMVSDMVPHQMAINRILSNYIGRAITDKLTVLIRDGAGVSPDDYTNPRNHQKIYYTGTPPTYQQPPPLSGANFQLIEFLLNQMENIAGVHDVSQGTLPRSSGSLAAASIHLLQNADQSKLSVFVGNIESALTQLGEWELALYRQFGLQEPRLIGLDDQAVPGKAITRAAAFAALRNGGNCRVVVTPGSGMARMPEAKAQQLERWYQMGVFGPPGSPAATKTFLEEQDTVRSDDLAERVSARLSATGSASN
ncbi:MAG TPA: hypothetical protein VGK19_21365 [Capsulimonadaceae bacterium]|jgi:hypothetical protein